MVTSAAGVWLLLPYLALGLHPAWAEAAPPNDECAEAIPVSTDEPYLGTTVDASGTDLTSCGRSDTRDVWHTWRATCSGQARISLCGSNFDTVLAVFDRCGGAQLACSNDAPEECVREDNSLIAALTVTNRTRYWIRVSGASGEVGEYLLNVSCTEMGFGACCLSNGSCLVTSGEACQQQGGRFFRDEPCAGLDCSAPQPPNDLCLNAAEVVTDIPFAGSTVNATGRQPGACGQDDGHDVWHVWRCDCPSYADLSVCASDFDTILSVFSSCDGAELACSDDSPLCVKENGSRLRRLPVAEGVDYLIRISGENRESGQYELLARCVKPRRKGTASRREALSVDPLP